MIKIKRGILATWLKQTKPLADGQPGYDRTNNKIKLGDGKSSWKDLPYLIGQLDMKTLLQPEDSAEITNDTVFTYGYKIPDKNTKGKIYLQQYNGDVEKDYVIDLGRNANYFYRKWNSGFIECWGNGECPANVETLFKTKIFNIETNGCFEIKGFWN